VPKVIYDKRHQIDIDATETVYSFRMDSSMRCRGGLSELIVELPNFTNSITTQVSITRAASGNDITTALDMAALAENADHAKIYDPPILVSESDLFVLTLSGVAGGTGGTAYVTPIVTE
jgi:hypothetical protein